MNHLDKPNRWWLRGLVSVSVLVPLLALLIWVGWSDQSSAQGDVRSDVEFNHSSTGFQLTGGHAQVVCERCHAQGVFRGTPTQCFQCHSPGGRVMSTFKPANHLPTTVNCNSCHRTTNWVPAFFTHNGVTPGTCATCHDNSIQRGKPATHIPTTQSCDACHRPTMWTAVAFTHAGVTPGTCATCHNGVQATGKSATHIQTGLSCDSCHTVGTTWALARSSYDHTGITSGCANCHNGSTALGRPSNHIPLSALSSPGCETCHRSTITFSGTLMNHSGIATGCTTCHATGMRFVGSIVTKPTTHFPTTAGCETCHNTTAFGPGTPMTHTGITTGCASCHASGMNWIGGIVTKPTNHFPTTAPCESCHTSTTSFAGTPFSHPGIAVGSGTCASCHAGTYVGVVGKPAMHITTSSSCDTCHRSLTSFTGISTPNHSTFSPPVTTTTTCATANCHDGRTAVGKPANHIPIATTQCGSCHTRWPTTTPATFGPGTLMSHTGITTGCATCHATGSSFFGVTMVTKPVNHFPYSPTTTGCESCHSTVAFGPATPYTHPGVSIGSRTCGTCHTGTYVGVVGKPAMHVTTSSSCDTCHTSLTTFTGISTPNHSTFTPMVTSATTCAAAGCHDGRTAIGKPANHIPVTTTQCGTCHTRWPTTTPATFGPGTPMNHTGITTGCATCHGAGQSWVGGVVTKPSNHFPTTSPCELCHRSTTTFSGTAMNHTGITTGCATCHGAGQSWAGGVVTKPSNHFPTTSPCELCHRSTTTFSGTAMNHTGITTGCATCHGAGLSWAGGIVTKPANHFPTTSPCELCHKSTLSGGFAGTTMNHTGITTGCATCHGAGLSWIGGIVTKPASHFPTTAACELCHLSTNSFSGTRMVHTTLTGIVPGGCNTCHEAGMNWVGGIVTRPRDHTGTRAAPHSCDNSGCHRGYSSF